MGEYLALDIACALVLLSSPSPGLLPPCSRQIAVILNAFARAGARWPQSWLSNRRVITWCDVATSSDDPAY